MQHTGYVYLGKTLPKVERTDSGQFRLVLVVLDNMEHTRGKERYHLRWTGPEAAAFWQAHQADLVPGAILDVQLTDVRVHTGTSWPPLPELRADIVTATYCPRRERTEEPA